MTAVWMAFFLTALAGLATGVGSILVFVAKPDDYRFLSVSTGFSAGVMLYVSFVEIFYKGMDALVAAYGDYWGHWLNAGSFFAGMALIALIDNLVPAAENPHEVPTEEEMRSLCTAPGFTFPPLATKKEAAGHGQRHKLMRMGIFTALAIAIHNFPEGLATFFAALQDPGLGMAIAFAIALHNIPEGISVSVPVYYATGSRVRAFFYSFGSGLAEPVGAGIAYLLLRFLWADESGMIPSQIMGLLFGGVAGIMVYISLDELLPASRAYSKGHDSILGLVGGMAVMAVSLLLMQ